jgi:hypothetical protein
LRQAQDDRRDRKEIMSRIHKCITAGALLAATAALAGAFTSAATASKRAECPGDGTPPPGSTITGGLDVGGGVDGYCELHDVTVKGGIRVEPTPDSFVAQGHWNAVNLIGSTVAGGVVVGAGSEVDANINFADFSVTPDPSTINGGLRIDQGRFTTVVNATIRGGLAVNGDTDNSLLCEVFGVPPEFCFGSYAFCGLTIDGNVSETDINRNQAFLGDPREQFFANADCRPNTIHGSVRMTNSNFIRFDGEPSEIEGDTVTGSVILDHSTAEVNENIIGGSLLCINGSVVHEPPPPDVAGNGVRGKDTCD